MKLFNREEQKQLRWIVKIVWYLIATVGRYIKNGEVFPNHTWKKAQEIVDEVEFPNKG